MRTKTYILTLSTHFPKGHPREGEETNFECAARRGLHNIRTQGAYKLHTIRANYDLWKHRIDEVNAGRAVLSVREWLGAPRRSKQRELFRLDRDSGIGVEKLDWIAGDINAPAIRRGDLLTPLYVSELSANDGLTLNDWRAWFKDWKAWFRDYDKTKPMAIIHFTNFRYCK